MGYVVSCRSWSIFPTRQRTWCTAWAQEPDWILWQKESFGKGKNVHPSFSYVLHRLIDLLLTSYSTRTCSCVSGTNLIRNRDLVGFWKHYKLLHSCNRCTANRGFPTDSITQDIIYRYKHFLAFAYKIQPICIKIGF